MGFTIDWGTLAVSIPVIAATAVGAVKFVAKAYFKKHIDERFETYKNELNKDMEEHKNELQKDMEKYKYDLEKEQNEYIKKLDSKMKISDAYIEMRYTKITEIRELVQRFYFTVKNVSPADEILTSPMENELITHLESNRLYFTIDFINLIQKFATIIEETRLKKYKSHALSNSDRFDSTQKLAFYEDSHSSLKKMEKSYHTIEEFLRDDYLNAKVV
ncbi:hypothetical protein BSK59_13940 [Paenibacillus odorifer]|uniref:hypothetical protein n=1 Tax=Paenibacillus odorifer TaxID=189426 RepID=UPI00096FAC80|nr:hypothetical protein [Paenibacillus odorifer]OME55571.1 hypothetical protein BSK59_13940 [Paenibacillus odorifer]